MFKHLKSAIFWYYLYKFRKRVIIIVTLILVSIFASAIYQDLIQYLSLKNKLQYLEIALFSKWFIIFFSLIFSFYLILTLFKSKKEEEKVIEKSEEKKSFESLNSREKEFLYKKKLKTKADFLVEK